MKEPNDTPAFMRRRQEPQSAEVHYRSAADTMTFERPLRISRTLPDANTPVTDTELAGLEALCALMPGYPVREAEHPITGEMCVIVDDDDAEFCPAEIVSSFGQDNPALAVFFAQAMNNMPRLIAEIRRSRSN
jgi:hypothetical protein